MYNQLNLTILILYSLWSLNSLRSGSHGYGPFKVNFMIYNDQKNMVVFESYLKLPDSKWSKHISRVQPHP